MATRPKPTFVGKITIASRNNKVYWWEALGGDLSATLTSGDYWPADLCAEIKTQMDAASAATWTVTFDVATGKITITSTTGFYPKCKSTDTANALTGGHQDLASNTLATGEVSVNHLGFNVVSAYPSQASSHTSDRVIANCWVPDGALDGRCATDDEGQLDFYTVDATAVDGSGSVLDFTPITDDSTDPLRGSPQQRQAISFELLNRTSQEHFLLWFARTWACRGNTFRYYPDRDNTPSTYSLKRFTTETRASALKGARRRGYSWYDLSLTLERAAS